MLGEEFPMNADKAPADRVIIFDTTLRDGEQSPGATMNIHEKLEIARQLARLGVDVMEAGFPASSPGDFEAVAAIAKEIGNLPQGPVICALARTNPQDIRCAGEALEAARADRRRIHVFIATSKLHMEKKLRLDPEQVIEQTKAAVQLAGMFTHDVEFSCEDASRTDLDFMCRVVQVAVDAGATTINIPDTVGYALPQDYAERITYLREHVRGIEKCVISVHCHNDLGLAVANSLSGVMAGARQVECTINGIGERAGNASLEEVVMALRTRNIYFGGLQTGINTSEIYRTSQMVSRVTGMRVQPNKAIVGANAFAHEAGIHQDGMIKDRSTYEIMEPATVGWVGEGMVMGKHSGRNAFKQRLEALGFLTLNPDQINRVFSRFKGLCDAKKDIYDEDIYAIVEEELERTTESYELVSMQIISSTDDGPFAEVHLRRGEEPFAMKTADGAGPIDALFKCLQRIFGLKIELVEYGIDALSRSIDAQGRVIVRLRVEGRELRGHGTDTDILVASAKAYLSAMNRYFLTKDAAVFAGAGPVA
jgi:2-isopropylmalate synthase